MSAEGTRAAVEAELNALTLPDGELGKNSSRSTSVLYGPTDFSRRRFQAEVIEQYLDLSPQVGHDGLATAVVTAGPPGAGKTTLVEARGYAGAGWRVIDADKVKEILLERAKADGIYDDLLSRNLADSHPILLNELASLVHAESATIARYILDRSLEEQENVVIEGTLTWPGLAGEYLLKLAANDYHRLTIVDVEVPLATALENAGERWWLGRLAALDGTGDPAGGRFTPRDAISASFPSGAVSVCNQNATRLFNDPRSRNFEEIRLIVDDRTLPEEELYEFVANYGTVTGPWPNSLQDLHRLKRLRTEGA